MSAGAHLLARIVPVRPLPRRDEQEGPLAYAAHCRCGWIGAGSTSSYDAEQRWRQHRGLALAAALP